MSSPSRNLMSRARKKKRSSASRYRHAEIMMSETNGFFLLPCNNKKNKGGTILLHDTHTRFLHPVAFHLTGDRSHTSWLGGDFPACFKKSILVIDFVIHKPEEALSSRWRNHVRFDKKGTQKLTKPKNKIPKKTVVRDWWWLHRNCRGKYNEIIQQTHPAFWIHAKFETIIIAKFHTASPFANSTSHEKSL